MGGSSPAGPRFLAIVRRHHLPVWIQIFSVLEGRMFTFGIFFFGCQLLQSLLFLFGRQAKSGQILAGVRGKATGSDP